MPLTALSTIKNWFKTGLKPTQAQFWDTWDSFWHKSETIPQSSVTGLVALETRVSDLEADATGSGSVLLGGTGSTANFTTEGKIIDKIRVKSTGGMTLNMGTSPSGTEILDSEEITADTVAVVSVMWDVEASTTIYFSGLSGTWTIRIILQ